MHVDPVKAALTSAGHLRKHHGQTLFRDVLKEGHRRAEIELLVRDRPRRACDVAERDFVGSAREPTVLADLEAADRHTAVVGDALDDVTTTTAEFEHALGCALH